MSSKKITESSAKKMTGNSLRDTEVRGFVLQKRKTGKFFYYEYQSPVTRKNRKHPLGKHGEVTVDAAREQAKIAAGQAAKGVDPQEQKQAVRASIERQKKETLGAFLEAGYRDVTPTKTADEVIPIIKKHFNEYLDKPMSAITPWSMEKWKKAYPGKPSGANRILTRLRGVLSKAVKAGLLLKSPLSEVKKLKEDKNKKIRYLAPEEEHRLLTAIDNRQTKHREERQRHIKWCRERSKEAPEELADAFTDHIKPMVLVKLNTGLRRGELFNLKVSDLDLNARLLTVVGDGAKSGQTRQVFLNDTAFQALVSWLNQTQNNELVFPSPVTGKRFDNIYKSWREIRAKAGLPDLRLHDLRHTFGTRLAHNRVDLVTIKELMGHESLDTTARYLHTSDERKMRAVQGLAK